MRRDRPQAAGTRRAVLHQCVPVTVRLPPAQRPRPRRAAGQNKKAGEAISSRTLLELRIWKYESRNVNLELRITGVQFLLHPKLTSAGQVVNKVILRTGPDVYES